MRCRRRAREGAIVRKDYAASGLLEFTYCGVHGGWVEGRDWAYEEGVRGSFIGLR